MSVAFEDALAAVGQAVDVYVGERWVEGTISDFHGPQQRWEVLLDDGRTRLIPLTATKDQLEFQFTERDPRPAPTPATDSDGTVDDQHISEPSDRSRQAEEEQRSNILQEEWEKTLALEQQHLDQEEWLREFDEHLSSQSRSRSLTESTMAPEESNNTAPRQTGGGMTHGDMTRFLHSVREGVAAQHPGPSLPASLEIVGMRNIPHWQPSHSGVIRAHQSAATLSAQQAPVRLTARWQRRPGAPSDILLQTKDTTPSEEAGNVSLDHIAPVDLPPFDEPARLVMDLVRLRPPKFVQEITARATVCTDDMKAFVRVHGPNASIPLRPPPHWSQLVAPIARPPDDMPSVQVRITLPRHLLDARDTGAAAMRVACAEENEKDAETLEGAPFAANVAVPRLSGPHVSRQSRAKARRGRRAPRGTKTILLERAYHPNTKTKKQTDPKKGAEPKRRPPTGAFARVRGDSSPIRSAVKIAAIPRPKQRRPVEKKKKEERPKEEEEEGKGALPLSARAPPRRQRARPVDGSGQRSWDALRDDLSQQALERRDRLHQRQVHARRLRRQDEHDSYVLAGLERGHHKHVPASAVNAQIQLGRNAGRNAVYEHPVVAVWQVPGPGESPSHSSETRLAELRKSTSERHESLRKQLCGLLARMQAWSETREQATEAETALAETEERMRRVRQRMHWKAGHALDDSDAEETMRAMDELEAQLQEYRTQTKRFVLQAAWWEEQGSRQQERFDARERAAKRRIHKWRKRLHETKDSRRQTENELLSTQGDGAKSSFLPQDTYDFASPTPFAAERSPGSPGEASLAAELRRKDDAFRQRLAEEDEALGPFADLMPGPE